MRHTRTIPSLNRSDGSAASSIPWGDVTSKPDWTETIAARVDALEATEATRDTNEETGPETGPETGQEVGQEVGQEPSEETGSAFSPASALFEDAANFYFVIPNGGEWRVRRQDKDDLALTTSMAASEPVTLTDVQNLEYS